MQTKMTFLQTVRILLRHRKLADMRNLSSQQNKFAKGLIYVSIGFLVIYLIGLSIPAAMIANESRTTTSAEMLCIILPFILLFDFCQRWIGQQTPSQIVKPYTLLPLSRYACMDAFIISSILSWSNYIWLAFVLPYVLMSMLFSYGFVTSLLAVAFVVVMLAANSQWYSIVRTLVNDKFVWWALPISVYALLIGLPMYAELGLDKPWFSDLYSYVGYYIDCHNIFVLLMSLTWLLILVNVNRQIQFVFVQRELMRVDKKEEVKNVNKFTFLERYGEIGSFMQLELKLMTRNKNPRKAFITSFITIGVLSVLIIFSDIYDSSTMTNFWALYNFVMFGASILTRIMGFEGNYIDCLLVRRENILALLQAKYIFYSILLIVPFMLMLPVVFSGKWSLYMLLSYGVFTMGFQYFCIFQTAVYNRQTIPLNEKLTSKGGLEGNYIQMIIMFTALLVPVFLVNTLQTFLSDNVAYSIMLAIGLVFVATHRLWLRNIYNRMMKKKYAILESFTTTR